VSLTATAGYTFAGLSADSFIYTYAGATAVNPAGSGNTITATISFPATAAPGENTVSDIDLTALVSAPVRGATPDATPISIAQYAGTIIWNPAHSTFAPSTAYQAVVSLIATTGYTFTGVVANSFSHSGAETITNPAGSGNTITVTISFPATAAPGENTVSDLNLTALVIAPVKGATPNTAAINEPQYTGAITWTPAHSLFAPSTAYQAEVVLIAKAGHTFAGVSAGSFSHTHTGTTTTNPAGSEKTITVTISFPATAADMVSAFDLTSLVAAPVKGATPATAINAPQYTGAITWTPAHSTFAPSTAYQAAVVLTATTGHTFAGVGAGSFSHSGAATMTNPTGSGNTLTVTINFPATAADVVNAFDLTFLAAAPVKGATPAMAINAPQYTGIITWTPAHSTFAPSTTYQAEVVLMATTGHTFVGVGAGSFSHTYAGTTISNTVGSGNTITVTISFPATADPEHTITVDPDAGEGALSQETFTVSKGDGESETVNIIGSDYTNPRWFVDGDLLDETGTSVTIGAADYSVGKHNLTLLITKSGVSWSKEITFTVTN
jgi:hypothetical protein